MGIALICNVADHLQLRIYAHNFWVVLAGWWQVMSTAWLAHSTI